jgi:hypothetical protein
MYSVVLCLLLFQNADYKPSVSSAADAVKREVRLREVAAALSDPHAKEYVAVHDEAFVEKFNALINKLMDFSDSYKTRNAIDVKKAEAVRKAWRELEKSEALFREDSKK